MQISPFQFLFAGRVEARTDYAQTLVPQTLERLSRPRKSAPSSVAARVGFQGGDYWASRACRRECTLTGSQVLADGNLSLAQSISRRAVLGGKLYNTITDFLPPAGAAIRPSVISFRAEARR